MEGRPQRRAGSEGAREPSRARLGPNVLPASSQPTGSVGGTEGSADVLLSAFCLLAFPRYGPPEMWTFGVLAASALHISHASTLAELQLTPSSSQLSQDVSLAALAPTFSGTLDIWKGEGSWTCWLTVTTKHTQSHSFAHSHVFHSSKDQCCPSPNTYMDLAENQANHLNCHT